MAEGQGKKVLGVLGGLGPVASAEFIRTIYDYYTGEAEQAAPVVMLYSDPSFPDRTTAFLNGRDDTVLEPFIRALEQLRGLGAAQVVVCCVTIHYLLPQLPPDLRDLIISAPTVTLANIRQTGQKHLMLCSTGTRKLGLFQREALWEQVQDCVVFPDEDDQQLVHQLIYHAIKRHQNLPEVLTSLESLLVKYQVNAFAVGCSEIHILAKHFMADADNAAKYSCADPFDIIARQVAAGALP